MSQVNWSGYIHSEQGMSTDTAKEKITQDWHRPIDKLEVKSFLQMVQLCQVFMGSRQTGGAQTNVNITRPLCQSKAQNIKRHKNARIASNN